MISVFKDHMRVFHHSFYAWPKMYSGPSVQTQNNLEENFLTLRFSEMKQIVPGGESVLRGQQSQLKQKLPARLCQECCRRDSGNRNRID